jgi:D-lactate dehydrogenase (cytochrome)
MDLIDLFIGAEGTLGIIVNATLRIATQRPAWCLAFVPFRERSSGIAFARTLRDDAKALGVSAIEHMDGRSLELAREDELDRKAGVHWPADTALALLITIELPPGTTAEQAFDQIGRGAEPTGVDTTLGRFCRALAKAEATEDVEIALPGESARMAQLLALREGIPAAVNQRIERAKRQVDSRIEKTAGDTIVPFDRLHEMLSYCDREFAGRGLDTAVWGHISDGNLHPNVLARSFADVEAGRAALLAIGREAIRLGGSPLAEHGVGRNPVKQALLKQLYGREGLDQMRAVKRAFDPDWKLAPGVLFPPE